MSTVRLRRLQSDYESMRRLARLHPRIAVEGVTGNPPDRYRLVLKVRSLRERGGTIEPADEHRLEIALPQGYPRDAPLVRMLTPVFHPNIAPHAVCVGDHWSAAESLDALVQRVGEMLAYQSYNTKSPLNGQAAQWVDEHPGDVPTDREEFFVDLASAPAEEAPAAGCSNCGAADQPLAACPSGHRMCPDCITYCPMCGRRVLCLSCGAPTCADCVTAAVPS